MFYEEKKRELDSQDTDEHKEQDKIISNIRKLHQEEMYVKRREFEDKQQADIERYMELERQKAKQLEEFQSKIAELKLLQDREFKNTQIEDSLSLKQKEVEIKELE